MFPILFLVNNIFITLAISIVFCCILRLFNIDKRIYTLICVALLLHVALTLFIQTDLYKYHDPEVLRAPFFNDGECYSSNALVISKTIKGEIFPLSEFKKYPGWGYVLVDVIKAAQNLRILNIGEYQIGFITYLYSVIYAAYGYLPSYINMLSILLNLITALIIFKISGILFNRRAGYIAAALFLFNPTSFYYSTMKLKDPLYIFSFYLAIYLAVLFIHKRNVAYLLLMILPLLLIKFLKIMFFEPFLLILLIYFVTKFFSKRKLQFVVIPLAAIIFFLNLSFITERIRSFFVAAAQYQANIFSSGGYTYKLLIFGPDVLGYNYLQMVAYFINAWYHLLMEPILTINMSFILLAYHPIKIIFVFLYILAVLGIISSFRYQGFNYRENVLLLSFLFFIGSIIAMTSGNIGTMLRQKDLITPVIFIYAAYFISRLNLNVSINQNRSLR